MRRKASLYEEPLRCYNRGENDIKWNKVKEMQIDLKSNVGLQVMPIDELIERVASVCKRCGAEHLDLFGSFATGTATARSDIDFVVYGDVDSELLNQMISQIDTLRKIDIFYYNEINDEYLLEDGVIWKKNILIVIVHFAEV